MTRLAYAMQIYPPHHVLSGDYIVHEINLSLVPNFMDKLVPRNSLIFIFSQHFQQWEEKDDMNEGSDRSCSLVEPYYGTKYGIDPYSAQQLESWTDASSVSSSFLHPPEANLFIPTDFALKTNAMVDIRETPSLIALKTTLSHNVEEAASITPPSIKPTPGTQHIFFLWSLFIFLYLVSLKPLLSYLFLL